MTWTATGSEMGSNTLTQLSDQTNRVMFMCVCAADIWSKCTIFSRSPSDSFPSCMPNVAVLVLPFAHICLFFFQSPASLHCREKLSGIWGFCFFFRMQTFWQRDHAHSQPPDPVSALTSAQLWCWGGATHKNTNVLETRHVPPRAHAFPAEIPCVELIKDGPIVNPV